jgi:murein DD-endopeptidase MepM/ murein hydrolase activator NlpD
MEDDELLYSISREKITEKILFPVHTEDFTHLTSAFGKRSAIIGGDYAQHRGVDIAGSWRARVLAAADGIVIDHWLNHPIKGKAIYILHPDGSKTGYLHLSESYVHERDKDGNPWKVKAGDVIGRVGNTGLSDGDHLHFSVEIDGVMVNPMLYLTMPE